MIVWRKTLYLLLILTTLVTFFIFLPRIASTSPVKSWILHFLRAETNTTVVVEDLRLSWFGPQRFSHLSFSNQKYQGNIETLQIGTPLWTLFGFSKFPHLDQINGNLKLENGSFSFQNELFPKASLNGVEGTLLFHKDALDFTLSGKCLQNSLPGSFSLQGQVHRPFDPAPEFSVHGKLDSFPSLPLAWYLAHLGQIEEQKLAKILGTPLQAEGSASLGKKEGILDLSLRAPNIEGEFHGKFVNHDLMLRDALNATIRLTPELSELLLRGVNPLFITGLHADSPLQLRIEARGFHCPLFPFQLDTLRIGQGTLEMGKVRCGNSSSLTKLGKLFKGGGFPSSSEIEIWFSPCSFRLHNGILQASRMDALIADSVHICTWGNIDLIREEFDMFLGLPEDTLRPLFHIQNLPENYVLKIPLTGSFSHPSLATKAALAKIAALAAAQKATKRWFPGQILNVLARPDPDVPPPQLPFPWQSH